jgi:hypothetical protein
VTAAAPSACNRSAPFKGVAHFAEYRFACCGKAAIHASISAVITAVAVKSLMASPPAATGLSSELATVAPRGRVYGALLFMQAQSFVRPDRVGIMGWSQGGGALLFAIGTQSFSRPAQLPRGDFRAAVAFYPSSCDEQRQQPSSRQLQTYCPLGISRLRELARFSVRSCRRDPAPSSASPAMRSLPAAAIRPRRFAVLRLARRQCDPVGPDPSLPGTGTYSSLRRAPAVAD